MRDRDWTSIRYSSPSTWYASREATPSDNTIVLKTSDAGRSWSPVLSGAYKPSIASWKGNFSSGEKVFWLPTDSEFMCTADGGNSWTRSVPEFGAKIDAAGHLDISNYPMCYCLMKSGFFKSTDGGVSWTRWPDSERSWYVLNRNMIVTRDNRIYLHTYDRTSGHAEWKLYRSMNGGGTWDSVGVVQHNVKFSYIDENGHSVGYIDRYDGTFWLVSTMDEWYSFSIEEVYSTAITDILFLDSRNGFLTTKYSILKTTNGGINWTKVTPSLPQSPRIISTWPQPVSQGGMMSTEIELTRPGPVRIELYDLLGRRRVVVLDAEVTATRRTVQWSTIGLERGVYVLRLVTGSGVANTKVMVK